MNKGITTFFAFLLALGVFAQNNGVSNADLVKGVYKGIYKSKSMPHSIIDYRIEVQAQNDSTIEIIALLPNQTKSFLAVLYSTDNEQDENGNPIRLDIKSPTGIFDRTGYFYPASGMIHYSYQGGNPTDPANFEIFTGEKE
jgi:hypothetical protein